MKLKQAFSVFILLFIVFQSFAQTKPINERIFDDGRNIWGRNTYVYKDQPYKGNAILPILLSDKSSAETAKKAVTIRNIGIGLITGGIVASGYGITELGQTNKSGFVYIIGGAVAMGISDFIFKSARAKRADALSLFNAEKSYNFIPLRGYDTIETKDIITVKDVPFLGWNEYYIDGKRVHVRKVLTSIKNNSASIGYYDLYRKNNTAFWVGLGGLGASYLYLTLSKGKGNNTQPDEVSGVQAVVGITGFLGSLATIMLTQRGANKSINNGIRVLNNQKPIFYNNKHRLAYKNPMTVSVGMGNYGYGLLAKF